MLKQNLSSELVWNLKIRLIHWGLALIILINLFIFDEGDKVHSLIGYFGLGLVVIRFIIGLTAKDFSSFKKFPLHPTEVFSFIQNIFKACLIKTVDIGHPQDPLVLFPDHITIFFQHDPV